MSQIIFQMIVALFLLGIFLYIVGKSPIPGWIGSIINLLAALLVVGWILQVFFGWHIPWRLR